MNNSTRKIVTSAMLIAIGFILTLIPTFIPFLNLPFGGTITIASMLPIIIISYMYGIKWGLSSALIFSLLQISLGYRVLIPLFTPNSENFVGAGIALLVILLDYVLAYGILGLGGMFRNKMNKTSAIVLGSVLVLLMNYFFHFLSGTIFYGAWATWFFTETIIADLNFSKWIMDNLSGFGLASIYSIIYNGCYMIPEIIVTAIVAVPISHIPLIRK